MTPARPHRIVRQYHIPRTLGLALAFVICLILARDGAIEPWLLGVAAAIFLVYPQLARLRARGARDSKAAELQNLLFDAVLMGAWAALSGFHLGLSFAMFAAAALNNAMNRGPRGVLHASICFAGGGLAAVAVTGLRFEPESSLIATVVSLAGLLTYVVGTGVVLHRHNRQLARIRREIERRRRAFETLAEAGVATASARTIDEVAERSLDHLQRIMPSSAGYGLVLREAGRPRLVHYRACVGMDEETQAWLCQQPGAAPGTAAALAADNRGRDGCTLYPLWIGEGRVRGLDGVFALHDENDSIDPNIIALYLQQLRSALENCLLTRELLEFANTDALTGLANRSRLDQYLAQVRQQKQRDPGIDFTVIVADINGLKEVNDVHGHAAGDRMITTAAGVLRSVCRETDLIARVGGDEFAVVCPATVTDEGQRLVARLAAALDTTRVDLSTLGGPADTPLHLSLGCADSRECRPDAVMRAADRRMYRDKSRFYAGTSVPR